MENIEIKDIFESDVKRFYLPITIEKECPYCKAKCIMDLNELYLDYPVFNSSDVLQFCCDECDREFEVDMKLTIGLQIGTKIRKINGI